ncbi:MAG TPA: MraY family glycosyltransferase [Terriglobales bacterium]|nr:MraY family glycosyltransferase [Terriglobales bacterium]
MTLVYLGTFASSLLVSFIATKVIRDLANRKGWVSAPHNPRHLHTSPLPRLGGVAIALSFFVAILLGLSVQQFFQAESALPALYPLLTIFPPALLIFLLGIYDDVRTVGPYLKFGVQALAGAMLFAGGLRISDIPLLFGTHQFAWFVGLPLTIFWVMAITNAFNLIDGLDGLAAGSALFSTMVMFVVAVLGGMSLVSLVTLALAGAILGFLRYNFNPATIFLGDCGSLFVGFLLSALALQGAQKAPTLIAVAIPLVSFGLPILETVLSIARRFISGRPVFTADREHIHHKLLEHGWSHRQVVIILYGVSAVFALLSLFLLWPTGSTLGLVLAVLGTGIWLGVQHLGYLEFGELRRVAQRTIEQRHIFVNNLAVRRAVEELKVAEDLPQIHRILIAAFDSNDFDAFELSPNANIETHGLGMVETGAHKISWRKAGALVTPEFENAWSLTLDLVSTGNRHCGRMVIFRHYSSRDLQLDINLLTSGFATSLADALQRTMVEVTEFVADSQESILLSAQAG